MVNSNNPHYTNEHFFTKDAVGLVVFLHKRQIAERVFDDDEAADEILSNYFSLISIEEAKELVSEEYERKN